MKKIIFLFIIFANSFAFSSLLSRGEEESAEIARVKARFAKEARGFEDEERVSQVLNSFARDPLVVRGSRIDVEDVETDRDVIILGTIESEKPWHVSCRNFLLLGSVKTSDFTLRSTKHLLIAGLEDFSDENSVIFKELREMEGEGAGKRRREILFSKFFGENGTLFSTGQIHITFTEDALILGGLFCCQGMLELCGKNMYLDRVMRTVVCTRQTVVPGFGVYDDGQIYPNEEVTTVTTTTKSSLRTSTVMSGSSIFLEATDNFLDYASWYCAGGPSRIRGRKSAHVLAKHETTNTNTDTDLQWYRW